MAGHDTCGRSTDPAGTRGTLLAMAEDTATLVELSAFGADARRAVSAARSEAAQLGHERIGTEHLLLGLLVDASTTAFQVLADRGASLAIVRTKVLEVRPRGTPAAEVPETASERAVRAIGRSVRFSHRRQTTEVTPEDLLIGVLDVEGTAGQVLRSLGIDVDDVRAALDGHERRTGDEKRPAGQAATRTPTAIGAGATCPTCGAEVLGDVRYHAVAAHGPRGDRQVLVFCCGACATVLGVAPADAGDGPAQGL